VRILISAGDFNGAAAYLEILKQNNKSNLGYDDLLAICYKKSGQHLKLLSLIKDRLEQQDSRPDLIRDYGEAHLLNGNLDSAQAYFFKSARLYSGHPAQLDYMAHVFQRLGHYDAERQFIDSLRKIFDDPFLLAMRRGDALTALKMFSAAANEYLLEIERDTIENREAADRLLALIEYPESADTVIAILAKRIKDQSVNKMLPNIYGRLLMGRGSYDMAFDFYRKRDSLENKSGGEIINFMRECELHENYQYVTLAGHYLLESYDGSPVRSMAYLLMADAFVQLGQFDSALANYEHVINVSDRSRDRIDAQLQMGIIYKNHVANLHEAKKYFEAVFHYLPHSNQGIYSFLGLADVYVREQSFDSAQFCYDSLSKQDLPDDLAEELYFHQARAYLFQGKYDESARQFQRLINRFPRGFFVNDAIQMFMILDETKERSSDHLDLFSQAEFFRHTQKDDSLEYYLLKTCRIGVPSLAPISYLNLALLYTRQEREREALEVLDSLTFSFPDSYFYPFGLKAKADILWLDIKSKDSARKIYREILENYSTYPIAAEIRDILRQEEKFNQL
jgi:tetratricopeptide (TPR) repeat protein